MKKNNWHKDIPAKNLLVAGGVLIMAAIALAYAAAGWKLRPASGVEVHMRKLGPREPQFTPTPRP